MKAQNTQIKYSIIFLLVVITIVHPACAAETESAFWSSIYQTFTSWHIMSWDVIKASILFSMTAFIPVSAIAYCRYRRNIRKTQLKFYLKKLGFEQEQILELINDFAHDSSLTSHRVDSTNTEENTDKKSSRKAYIERNVSSMTAFFRLLPSVFLATFIAFSGMSVLFYAGDISNSVNADESVVNLFLGGMKAVNLDRTGADCAEIKDETKKIKCQNTVVKHKNSLKRYQNGALLMMGMAAIGAVLWGLQHIVRRYTLFDINSRVYYSLAVRVMLASIISVVIYHSIESLTGGLYTLLAGGGENAPEKGDNISSIMPSIALLIGMFPQTGVVWLKSKFNIFSDENETVVKKLPLSMIQGVNQHDIIRLNEISIDNCYQLAEQRVIRFILMTPYPPNVAINWIAQAKLCVYFTDAINELRNIGILTIHDIYNPIHGDEEMRKTWMQKMNPDDAQNTESFEDIIVKETKVKYAQIRHIAAEIKFDRSIQELSYYNNKYYDSEIMQDKADS